MDKESKRMIAIIILLTVLTGILILMENNTYNNICKDNGYSGYVMSGNYPSCIDNNGDAVASIKECQYLLWRYFMVSCEVKPIDTLGGLSEQ